MLAEQNSTEHTGAISPLGRKVSSLAGNVACFASQAIGKFPHRVYLPVPCSRNHTAYFRSPATDQPLGRAWPRRLRALLFILRWTAPLPLQCLGQDRRGSGEEAPAPSRRIGAVPSRPPPCPALPQPSHLRPVPALGPAALTAGPARVSRTRLPAGAGLSWPSPARPQGLAP